MDARQHLRAILHDTLAELKFFARPDEGAKATGFDARKAAALNALNVIGWNASLLKDEELKRSAGFSLELRKVRRGLQGSMGTLEEFIEAAKAKSFDAESLESWISRFGEHARTLDVLIEAANKALCSLI